MKKRIRNPNPKICFLSALAYSCRGEHIESNGTPMRHLMTSISLS